jgi:hypothetical protein
MGSSITLRYLWFYVSPDPDTKTQSGLRDMEPGLIRSYPPLVDTLAEKGIASGCIS